MVDTLSNPLEIQITEVMLQKFNKSESLNILPQFVELVLYQSLFEPVIKAEMLINDKIGMFTNYPFTGEEFVQLTYKSLANNSSSLNTIRFIISGVRNIVADDNARALIYIVDLVSAEFLQNTRKLVSHAYADQIENIAESVYNEYIAQDTTALTGITKTFTKEETSSVRGLIVPNLRPLQAIQWLAKHAIAKDYDKKFQFLFYEDLAGFNFVTLQKLIEDGRNKKTELQSKPYTYRSEVELSGSKKYDPTAPLRQITNISINKRFSTIEKIASGYYQSELFEISMLQKAYTSTPTELSNTIDPEKLTLGPAPLNTPGYIDYVKNEISGAEYSNRVRYIINNYQDNETQGKSTPEYRLKIGKAIQGLIALNQVDLTITVPANMDLKAGQVIYLQIPEMHGFNKVELDLYITGLYIISEVKQIISVGNQASTTLRVYKDGYITSIIEKSFYNNGQNKNETLYDPGTGRPLTGGGA